MPPLKIEVLALLRRYDDNQKRPRGPERIQERVKMIDILSQMNKERGIADAEIRKALDELKERQDVSQEAREWLGGLVKEQ
jgi:hypothetical protein